MTVGLPTTILDDQSINLYEAMTLCHPYIHKIPGCFYATCVVMKVNSVVIRVAKDLWSIHLVHIFKI